MLTPRGSLPQIEQSLFFGPNCCTTFWNGWNINFPIFSFWDILQKWFFYQFGYRKEKDVQCYETDLFFVRFLVFEIWSILYFTFVMRSGLFLNPPLGLRPWTPHALGLKALASLVSIWIKFAKISSTFFASPQFTLDHCWI